MGAALLLSTPVDSSRAGVAGCEQFVDIVRSESEVRIQQLLPGDFNGDGVEDLAIGGFVIVPWGPVAAQVGHFTLMLGDGRGGFTPTTVYRTGGNTANVGVGDFDEDESLDVVVVSSSMQPAKLVLYLGGGDGTLAAPIEFDFGDAGHGVAVGDLDGDGHQDVMVMHASHSKLSVLLGDGNGNFQPPYDAATVTSPSKARLTDLNHDGRLDVVLVQSSVSISTVSVLLAEEDGSFGPPTELDTDLNPRDVYVADVDSDGNLDLTVSNSWYSGTVVEFLGFGDGSFDLGIHRAVGQFPRSVAIAEFDGDDHPDLVVTTNGALSIHPGQGNGYFFGGLQYDGGRETGEMLLGDFDGDGDLDVVVSTDFQRAIGCFRNRGDGRLLAPQRQPLDKMPIEGQATGVASGDLDGDGDQDLVAIANRGSHDSTFSVYLNDETGRFSAVGSATLRASGARAVALGDLDGDGRLDLAAAMNFGVRTFLGNGDGSFDHWKYAATTWGVYSVALGDLDEDGKLDAVTANTGTSNCSVLIGNGDGGFQAARFLDFRGGPTCVRLADLDGDGHLDLAATARNSASYQDPGWLAIWLGDGHGGLAPLATYEAGINPRGIAVADLDLDGRLDVAVANRSESVVEDWGSISIYPGMGNGTLGERSDHPAGYHPLELAVCDLNDDGRPDVIATRDEYNGSTVSVLYGRCDGGFSPAEFLMASFEPTHLALGDFDGDDAVDLAVTSNRYDSVSIFENSRCGQFEPTVGIRFEPAVLELEAQGRWVSAMLEPPACFEAGAFDVSSIRFHGNAVGAEPVPATEPAPLIWRRIREPLSSTLTVRFDRAAVAKTLQVGNPVPVEVTGLLAGRPFHAAAAITVRGQMPHGGALPPIQKPGPTTLALRGAEPNPFNPRTVIRFDVPATERVKIVVFDLRGRLVAELLDAELPAGAHTVAWDGRTRDGGIAASGVYFVSMEASGRRFSRKILLGK